MTKTERKEAWIDQIKTAKYMANEAIEENPSDGGTCNFDEAMIKKKNGLLMPKSSPYSTSADYPQASIKRGGCWSEVSTDRLKKTPCGRKLSLFGWMSRALKRQCIIKWIRQTKKTPSGVGKGMSENPLRRTRIDFGRVFRQGEYKNTS